MTESKSVPCNFFWLMDVWQDLRSLLPMTKTQNEIVSCLSWQIFIVAFLLFYYLFWAVLALLPFPWSSHCTAQLSCFGWARQEGEGSRDSEPFSHPAMMGSVLAAPLRSLCWGKRMGADPKTTFTHFSQIPNGLSWDIASIQGLNSCKCGSLCYRLYSPRNRKELCKIKTLKNNNWFIYSGLHCGAGW